MAGFSWSCGVMLPFVVLMAHPGMAATRYDADGTLDPQLEVQRWLINRGRHDPERVADELGLVNPDNRAYDVCEDEQEDNDFGDGVGDWVAWVQPRGPLAPNARLNTACRNHSVDMGQTDVFSHNSPSSEFYPLGADPGQRQLAEGYDNEVIGHYENIAYSGWGNTGGYPAQGGTGAEFVEDLFVDEDIESRGHRKAILNADAREIGLGWHRVHSFDGTYFWTTDFTTQDYGRRAGQHFFTGTLFQDADGDDLYDPGEGVAGIEIRLFGDDGEAAWYDRSGASGEFAVPVADLPDGESVLLVLRNPGSVPRLLSIPLGFTTVGGLTLAPGEDTPVAYFTQPDRADNIGFRNVRPIVDCMLTLDTAGAQITFAAFPGVTYQVEARDDSGGWFVIDTLVADQEVEISIDPGLRASRHYRVRMLIE